jgi:hypothetical protein
MTAGTLLLWLRGALLVGALLSVGLAHRLRGGALGLARGQAPASPAPAPAAPSPDYRAELGARLGAQIEALSATDPEAAGELGARVDDRVGPLAEARYATGLAFNRARDRSAALLWYDRCLALAPLHRGALYDRAELRLLGGDTEGARSDLALLLAHPPVHWSTQLRVAQLAAMDRDSVAFERAMVGALAAGFERRTLGLDPAWRAWLDDPALGPILQRLIAVYGSEGLLDELRSQP